MAILDNNKVSQWDQASRDMDQYIGLQLPLVLDNGELASTKTTMEAVQQNLWMLCNTELGERVMQPTLGVQLKRFLFEPWRETIVEEVKDVLIEAIAYWMPFLIVTQMDVKMSDSQSDIHRNTMELTVHFALQQSPTTTDSVQITVGGDAGQTGGE
mgnify:CR=1 FL=1